MKAFAPLGKSSFYFWQGFGLFFYMLTKAGFFCWICGHKSECTFSYINALWKNFCPVPGDWRELFRENMNASHPFFNYENIHVKLSWQWKNFGKIISYHYNVFNIRSCTLIMLKFFIKITNFIVFIARFQVGEGMFITMFLDFFTPGWSLMKWILKMLFLNNTVCGLWYAVDR